MPSQELLGRFQNLFDDLQAIDPNKILRPEYDTDSLERHIGSEFRQLWKRYAKIINYIPEASNAEVTDLISITNELNKYLQSIYAETVPSYSNRLNLNLENLRASIAKFDSIYYRIQSSALDSLGNLKEWDVEKRFKPFEDTLTKSFEEKGREIIAKAEEAAKKIEEKARDAATKVSIEKAKQVFEDAERRNARTVRVWSVVTGLSYAAFITMAIIFYSIGLPEETGTPQAIYHSVMRVTLLAIVGAFSTFALKVLRSRLHLREHNMHRLRVTMCMPAFVESAFTADQRDMILTRMVDAVASFGTSGLVAGDDDSASAPKMTVDNIMRTFVTPTKSP